MISVVFSVMNRENNLMDSLTSWLSVPYLLSEFIVIDWSSDIPLINNNTIKNWVDNQKIKLFRVENEKTFSLSKSYNLAIRYSSNKIILKCDADYKSINYLWLKHLIFNDNMQLNNYFIIGNYCFSKSLTGFLLVNKIDFVGYNENFEGWGYDDIDLYNRIEKNNSNLQKIIFFNIQDYIYHIPHTEESRVINYSIKDKKLSLRQNKNKIDTDFIISKYKTIKFISNYYSVLERIKNDNNNM